MKGKRVRYATGALGAMKGKKVRYATGALVAMALVAGCAQEELVLKGAREALRPGNQAVAPVANPPELSLPPAQRNAAWPQRIGTPATRTPHAALATEPRLVWRAFARAAGHAAHNHRQSLGLHGGLAAQ